MRLQDHIDFTTLQWVKPELEQTLVVARQALETYVDHPDEQDGMRQCVESLHQVQGTLRMVELYGAAMVAEEMETLASELLEGHVSQRDDAYAALMRGLVQLPDYLERLSSGHRDVPVVLLPLLNELRASRDQHALHESAMFKPNLDAALPPQAPGASSAAEAAARQPGITELRLRFQQQLLAWFRGQSSAQQLAGMQQTLLTIAASCHTNQGRRLWWIAAAVLEGLDQGMLKSHAAEVRQLIGRVDRCIRQLIEHGEDNLHGGDVDDLTHKLLYIVAQARQFSPQMELVRQAYGLDALMPDSGELEHARSSMSGHNRALLDSVARALKDDLLRVKEALDLFLRQTEPDPQQLAAQADVLERVGDTLGMLALGVPKRVVSEQRRVLNEIADRQRQPDEETLLDVAGALLYVEASLDDHIDSLGADGSAGAEAANAASLLPRSEARSIMATLMQEAISNTSKVKDAIVAFVESGWHHAELAEVPRWMDEVGGAMRMLSAPRPGLLADGVGRFVGNELFGDRRVPSSAQMDQLADALAALEYYLEAAREHRGGLDHILDVAEHSLGALGYWPPPPAREVPEAPAPAAAGLEAEEHPPLSESVAIAAGDDVSALLVGDSSSAPAHVHDVHGMRLAETVDGAPLAGTVGDDGEWIEIEEEVVEQVPVHDALLDDAGFRRDASGIDDDIREIFLEEMQEEIDSLQANLRNWLADVSQLGALTPIRRSFHTLKGSGRLVGASLLGEFAWKVENMLNRVLDESIQPSEPVQAVAVQAIAALPQLLAALKGEGRPTAPLGAIMDVAERLAAGEPASLDDHAAPAMQTVRRIVRRRVPISQAAIEQVPPAASLAGHEPEEAASPEPASAPTEYAEPPLPPVDPVLLEILRSEVAQYLQTIRAAVSGAHGELPVDDALMRAVHTLHGAIAMVEITVLAQLLSPLESLLKRVRAAALPLDAEGVQLLGESADMVDKVMEQFDVAAPHLPDCQALTERLIALRDAQPEAKPVAAPVEVPVVEPATDASHDQPHDEQHAPVEAPAQDEQAHAAEDAEIAAAMAALTAAAAEIPSAEATAHGAPSAPYPFDHRAEESVPALPEQLPEAALLGHHEAASEAPSAAHDEAELAFGQTDQAHVHEGPAHEEPAHEEHVHQEPAHEAEQEHAEHEHAAFEHALPSSEQEPEAGEPAAHEPEEPELTAPIEHETHVESPAGLEASSAFFADSALPHDEEHVHHRDDEVAPLEAAVSAADEDAATAATAFHADPASHEAEAEAETAPPVAPEATEHALSEPEPAAPEQAQPEEAWHELAQTEAAESVEAEHEPAASEASVFEAASHEPAAAEDASHEDAAHAAEALAEPTHDHQAAPAEPAEPEGALRFGHIDADLLEIFTEEAREILDSADGVLAQWRLAPVEIGHVTSLLRDLHTLKGGARIAGLSPVGDLSHAMETMLERPLEPGAPHTGELIAALEAGFDQLHGMVQRVAQGRGIAYPQAMIDRCLRLAGEEGAAAALVHESSLAEPAETATPAAASETDASTLPALLPEELEEPRAPLEQIRVRAELLDNLVNHAGEVAIYRSRLEQQVAGYRFNLVELEQTVLRLRSQLRMLEIETEAQIIARFQREHREAGMSVFDPLELDRYSQLQQYSRALAESVSDLVSIQSMLDDLTRQAETLLLQQSRVSSELQEGLLRTRMLPFDTMVPNLRRTLRQAALEQRKEAQLFVEGAHGEMDRNLLDRLKAPFEHMLRNAIAHGIESPEERRRAGKSAEGAIRIRVAREATEVVVRLSDDGRGLDRESIRSRAVERRLLRPDSRPSDDQLLGLITQAGFSTASEVTQLAGRGVGMDVVANEIKQLGGVLAVESQPGRGTTFVMRLPFTLAVTQAILVRIGEGTFAIPMTSVQGVARITPDELTERLAEATPSFQYNGESYGIHDLAELLGIPSSHTGEEGQLPLLLTRAGDLRAAIRIDAVLGSREIVVKSVGPQISSVPGILGATIMGDGSVLIILDLAPLVRHGITRREQRLAEGLSAVTTVDVEEIRSQPLVMVVDDSITMRKVTGRVLERHDYEVSTAKDGVDALEKLHERVPDLMLLDIEMPRMDGYELATQMKADPRLRGVPIIMITSRSGDKHRQRAFDIGVDRYLGKPYQEADLLAQIAEVLQQRETESNHD